MLNDRPLKTCTYMFTLKKVLDIVYSVFDKISNLLLNFYSFFFTAVLLRKFSLHDVNQSVSSFLQDAKKRNKKLRPKQNEPRDDSDSSMDSSSMTRKRSRIYISESDDDVSGGY